MGNRLSSITTQPRLSPMPCGAYRMLERVINRHNDQPDVLWQPGLNKPAQQ